MELDIYFCENHVSDHTFTTRSKHNMIFYSNTQVHPQYAATFWIRTLFFGGGGSAQV